MKLSKRQGFKSIARPVILDDTGQHFYTPAQKVGGAYYFNLPAGEYLISEPLTPAAPRAYENRIKLPKPDRNIKASYAVEYDQVPTIGQIDHRARIIYLDKSLLFQPRHVREFVLFHELAHKKYSEELPCDLYAARQLFLKGYNPEQVIEGRQHLSGRNHPLTNELFSILRP